MLVEPPAKECRGKVLLYKDDYSFSKNFDEQSMTKKELESLEGLKEDDHFYWRNSLFLVESIDPFSARDCKRKVKEIIK